MFVTIPEEHVCERAYVSGREGREDKEGKSRIGQQVDQEVLVQIRFSSCSVRVLGKWKGRSYSLEERMFYWN